MKNQIHLNKPSACCSASRNDSSNFNTDKPLGHYRDDFRSLSMQLEEMILLPGGLFWMGSDDDEGFADDGEGPKRQVELQPFYINAKTVSNAEFMNFIEHTGYETEAELYGWSFVFEKFLSDENRQNVKEVVQQASWWARIDGADWKHPEGPGSNIQQRMDHPVVHVSWHDAAAYCKWIEARLPTEAEWEFAARGGLVQNRYPWGDTLKINGQHMCNIWQGKFPDKNHAADGYAGTAPCDEFPRNGYGLYNMSGNVWEWCADWFSKVPSEIKSETSKVMRGGSYMCHKSYCNRYRVAARSSNTPDSSTGHMGFRCARDATS